MRVDYSENFGPMALRHLAIYAAPTFDIEGDKAFDGFRPLTYGFRMRWIAQLLVRKGT